MIEVGARVRGWTVTMPLDSPRGIHELLAEDAAGGCVVLRVPADLDGVARIRQEADLARRHSHESLVQSVGLVEHNGWPVQVMEHIDGLTLDALSLVSGALPEAAVCHIGRQISLALVELHERAPVLSHGALGADRIVIDEGGHARLADLGRVCPQDQKRMLSPERRASEGRPSPADDLWALGMLLTEAALGHALELDDETGGTFDMRLLEGALPDRLVDALGALVAPADARLKNAGAAVRIFSDLEKLYGDGARELRGLLTHARLGRAFTGLAALEAEAAEPTHSGVHADAPSESHPRTSPDGKAITPFRGILLEAGLVSADESEDDEALAPSTIELVLEPRTIEMARDAVLNLADLQKLASPAPSVHEEITAIKVRPPGLADSSAPTAPAPGARAKAAPVTTSFAPVLTASDAFGGVALRIAALVGAIAALMALAFVAGMNLH